MNSESEFQEPSSPEIGPHDARVADIIFDLRKVSTHEFPAWELGNAICELETATKAKDAERLLPEDCMSMILALVEAGYVVLQHPSTMRYADDIRLGLYAVSKLIQHWSKVEYTQLPTGINDEIRILRNALHNADLHLRRQELKQKEQAMQTARKPRAAGLTNRLIIQACSGTAVVSATVKGRGGLCATR